MLGFQHPETRIRRMSHRALADEEVVVDDQGGWCCFG